MCRFIRRSVCRGRMDDFESRLKLAANGLRPGQARLQKRKWFVLKVYSFHAAVALGPA